MKKQEIFQLKITLVYSDPPIWRRFLVPNDISFEHLHFIVQGVMGWDNDHPFEFKIKNERLVHPEFAEPDRFMFGTPRYTKVSSDDVLLYERLMRDKDPI